MLRLSQPQPLVGYEGEENELSYIPLGVGIVIPPWNFPLAIMVGMTTAAIVSGNTVILKPSSETPAIAYEVVSILEEVGLPAGVLNFVPGPGSSVGDLRLPIPKPDSLPSLVQKKLACESMNWLPNHKPDRCG